LTDFVNRVNVGLDDFITRATKMSYTGLSAEALREVIDRAVREEREACAKIADERKAGFLADDPDYWGADAIAKAIRARSNSQ
jgi:hypothetical protein